MTMRVGFAVLAAPLALVFASACGAPDRSQPEPPASVTSQAQATCDIEHGLVTFDAPRADGEHVHGACDACLQRSCCDLTVQCFARDGTGPCAALGACLGACPARVDDDPNAYYACRDACRVHHEATVPLYDGYLACRTTSCRAACGDPP